MIALGLFCVGHREARQRVVQRFAFPHIAGKNGGIAPARVARANVRPQSVAYAQSGVALDDFGQSTPVVGS